MTNRSKRIADFKSSTAGAVPGGTTLNPMMIAQPLIIMFESDDGVNCHIHPAGYTRECYGLLICDLVRHVAKAFNVDEHDVWFWVDRERHDPTATIDGAWQ
jgi:hypothetical protein